MNELKEKLRKLKKIDQDFSVFGANTHRYNLVSPISMRAVESIESKYDCVFPDDYKNFITNIGNGGAGPFYGLFPIEKHDLDHGMCSWEEGYMVGNLTHAFPHSKAWNLPDSFWEKMPNPENCESEEQEEVLWEKWQENIDLNYWTPKVMNGAIPICHQGCAVRTWLVVTGPLKGTVWDDFRSEYKGIVPIKNPDGTFSTFTDWYLKWLRISINECKGGGKS